MKKHTKLLAIALLGLISFVASFMLPATAQAQYCDPGTIGNCTNLYITDQWCAFGCAQTTRLNERKKNAPLTLVIVKGRAVL